MASNEHRAQSEHDPDKIIPVYTLPGEIQGLIADESVLHTDTMVDLSVPENIETPTIALAWPFVYRTYFRFNTFYIPWVAKEHAKVSLQKWIWEKLDSRMVEMLARPGISPRIIVEVAIIVDKMPHGPLYPMAHDVPVRMKPDPDCISRLFELALKVRSMQPIEMQAVLVARHEEQLIDGEWQVRRVDEPEADGAEWRLKDTRLPVPEPIRSCLLGCCWGTIQDDLLKKLLKTTNGVPTKDSQSLSYRLLPPNGSTWFWTTEIPISPEVVKIYEDIARDPAMSIPHTIPYMQRHFMKGIAEILHDKNLFYDHYEILRHSAKFPLVGEFCTCSDCCPVES